MEVNLTDECLNFFFPFQRRGLYFLHKFSQTACSILVRDKYNLTTDFEVIKTTEDYGSESNCKN